MKMTVADMTSSQKRKVFLYGLMMFFFIGIIIGVFLVMRTAETELIQSSFVHQRLLKTSEKRTLVKVFLDSAIPVLLILLFQMISGLSAIGQPLCVFTLLHRGVSGGVSAALIYSQHGFKGFFIILVMLMPVMLFSMFILVLGAREAIKQSNMITCFAVGKNCEDNAGIRLYIIKFLVLSAFALLCALMDSTLTYIFTGLLLKP